MGRALWLVVGIGLVLGGCKDPGPDTTVPTPAPTTATVPVPKAPDVSKIPATIDEAYLNAVFAALDEVDGQSTRIIVAAKHLQPEAVDRLRAIFSFEWLRNELERWQTGIVQDPDLTGLLPNPGNQRTTVTRIIAAGPACVWIAVHRDYSKVNVVPGRDRTQYVALQPLDHHNDPKGLNPTAWMITGDGLRRDGTEPGNPCPPSCAQSPQPCSP